MTLDDLDTKVPSPIDGMDEANDMRSESADDVRRILVVSCRTSMYGQRYEDLRQALI